MHDNTQLVTFEIKPVISQSKSMQRLALSLELSKA
jgi:hypothetical protein